MSNPHRIMAAAMASIAALLVLAWAVVAANGRRACEIHDAPYAEFWCDARADADAAHLLERLARNPADLDALKLYARLAPSGRSSEVVAVLSSLSPADADVLRMRANDLASHDRWAEAVDPLMLLVIHHASDPAAAVLARLVAAGQWQLLLPYLPQSNRWLDRVLQQLRTVGAPIAAATPLVAQAVRARAIDPSTVRRYLGDLRKGGDWLDAYALWVAAQPQPVPVLYNASFDHPFVADGFDWEVQPQPNGARAGAVVERVQSSSRGGVLQVRLTGRRLANPLVRQYLFVAGTPYRLHGQYKTSALRMENGLAWTARCLASGAVAGRSPGLVNSGSAWASFDLVIAAPKDCGPVVSLELETAAAFEAETGGVGQVEFDAFALETAGSAPDKSRASR